MRAVPHWMPYVQPAEPFGFYHKHLSPRQVMSGLPLYGIVFFRLLFWRGSRRFGEVAMTNSEWERMTDPIPIMITEEEWLAAAHPTPMLTFLKKTANERKLRLFACARCRELWPDLIDERSRRAVEISERYADQTVSDEMLEEAGQLAKDAEASVAQSTQREHPYAAAARFVIFAAGPFCARLYTYFHPQSWHPDPQRECVLLRDLFGNAFRPVVLRPSWLTSTVLALARGIYEDRAFDRMPILADALQDADCDSEDILNHCRSESVHVRGCWVVDLLLGKK